MSALLIPPAVSASPSILSYATYLNGSSANAIAIDSSGNALVAGNGFVVKLDPTGEHILNSIFLPGVNVAALALDSSGNLVIAGSTVSGGFLVDAQGDAYIADDTESSDFPVTPGAAQTKFGGLVSALGVGFR